MLILLKKLTPVKKKLHPYMFDHPHHPYLIYPSRLPSMHLSSLLSLFLPLSGGAAAALSQPGGPPPSSPPPGQRGDGESRPVGQGAAGAVADR